MEVSPSLLHCVTRERFSSRQLAEEMNALSPEANYKLE